MIAFVVAAYFWERIVVFFFAESVMFVQWKHAAPVRVRSKLGAWSGGENDTSCVSALVASRFLKRW